jgi:hypothetical protein
VLRLIKVQGYPILYSPSDPFNSDIDTGTARVPVGVGASIPNEDISNRTEQDAEVQAVLGIYMS